MRAALCQTHLDGPRWWAARRAEWGNMYTAKSLDRVLSRLGLIAVSVIFVTAGLFLATSSVASAATNFFGTPTELSTPSGVVLESVSCASATDCTAVGDIGGPDGQPVYATESDGTWGAPTETSVAGGGSFKSVSCTDATDCTAVGGGSGNLFYATESDGTWGPVTIMPVPDNGDATSYFTSVSCTDATDCTAVGQSYVHEPVYATESDGTWGTPTEMPGCGQSPVCYEDNLVSVSCTSTTDCTAVGGGNDNLIYATESDGAWGPVTVILANVGGGGLESVSCTDATDCSAVGWNNVNGGQTFYVTESAGTWGPVTVTSGVLDGVWLDSLSCTSAGDCIAVGYDGTEVMATASWWTSPSRVAHGGLPRRSPTPSLAPTSWA